MNIYKKISLAKEEIKRTKLKKEGRNDFSKYNYFTPEQIETLVYMACINQGLITKFDLKRNEYGENGYLSIFDIETSENIIFEMATAIPEIKATNIAQQLGGCVTYTERYLKMTAFGITENALDFDQTPKKKESDVTNDLVEAINQIDTCESVDELELHWKTYPQFHDHETFKLKVKNHKAKLEAIEAENVENLRNFNNK